ncbi:MAG: J domain-containing protein [Deltaproteobacteria bacterium]|nr:J domain-containing protein [Deltaproteobacteria bacterium]
MDIERCFEVLELDPGASPDEAKQAYKDIVNVWHPDRFSNNLRLKEKAEEKIKEVNAAYDTVKSFLSSKQTQEEPEKQESPRPRSNAEARDNTEAMVEAGTNIILNACSYFYKTIRRFVADQAQKLEEKAEAGPDGPARKEWQGRGSGRGKGRGGGYGPGWRYGQRQAKGLSGSTFTVPG